MMDAGRKVADEKGFTAEPARRAPVMIRPCYSKRVLVRQRPGIVSTNQLLLPPLLLDLLPRLALSWLWPDWLVRSATIPMLAAKSALLVCSSFEAILFQMLSTHRHEVPRPSKKWRQLRSHMCSYVFWLWSTLPISSYAQHVNPNCSSVE